MKLLVRIILIAFIAAYPLVPVRAEGESQASTLLDQLEKSPAEPALRAGGARDYYERGVADFQNKNYQSAIVNFKKVWELDPNFPQIKDVYEYINLSQKALAGGKTEASPKGTTPEPKIVVAGRAMGSVAQAGLVKKDEAPGTEVSRLKGLGTGVLDKAEDKRRAAILKQARKDVWAKNFPKAMVALEDFLRDHPDDKEAQDLFYKARDRKTEYINDKLDDEKEIDEKEMFAQVAEAQNLPRPPLMPEPAKTAFPKTPLVEIPQIRKDLKKPVTVDFRDIPLSYILAHLTEATGVNIVPVEDLKLKDMKITVKFRDVPLEDALKYILRAQGLDYRIEKDAVLIASKEGMKREDVETRVYFLTRGAGLFTEFNAPSGGTLSSSGGGASISEITTIKDILEKAVSFGGDSKIVLDDRSGALIISNTPSNLKVVEDILYNLDITPVQVFIEARFIEVRAVDLEQFGTDFQLDSALAVTKVTKGAHETETEQEISKGSGVNLAALSRAATEGFNFTLAGILTDPQYKYVLNVLTETQKTKTLSVPKITTLNNQAATIKIVDEFIYPTRYEVQLIQFDKNGDGVFADAGETEFANVPQEFVTRDTGIVLRVTPSVGSDGKTITLALIPEVTEGTAAFFSYAGNVSLPLFTTRNLATSVVVNDGETVVLGGLIKESRVDKVTGIPFLSKIPIAGNFFKRTTEDVDRRNLLIFVTARILPPHTQAKW
ncbi:MAG: hypothetical protein HY589_04155 [Candidatus Omnitrophica bacterium]|nr:hypothetical protein [Candidatus Omnitrophota bacterium]